MSPEEIAEKSGILFRRFSTPHTQGLKEGAAAEFSFCSSPFLGRDKRDRTANGLRPLPAALTH